MADCAVRRPDVVLGLHVCAMVKQHLHDLCAPVCSGLNQRCLAQLRRHQGQSGDGTLGLGSSQ